MIYNIYPDSINGLNENTKLILKIVRGSYNDITNKSQVSSIRDLDNPGTEMSFFWPVYDKKNNTQTLKTYLHFDFLLKSPTAINSYTGYILNYCPTNNPPEEKLPIGQGSPTLIKKTRSRVDLFPVCYPHYLYGRRPRRRSALARTPALSSNKILPSRRQFYREIFHKQYCFQPKAGHSAGKDAGKPEFSLEN